MKQDKYSKTVAKAVAHTLNTVLRSDANSTSCGIAYQPRQPKEISRFRNVK